MIEFHPFHGSTIEADWFLKRNKICQVNDVKGIVAWRDQEILAMVLLDTWSKNSCQIHVAIDSPIVLRHGYKEEVLDYVFQTCDRGMIIGVTPSDNKKALKFNDHIGFVEVYRIKDAHEVGIDLVVQELRKEDYYGQAVSSRAA